MTDLRLRGFGIGAEDAALLGGLSRLQRLQLDGVAFAGRTIISKLASLQVTPPSPEPILRCLELCCCTVTCAAFSLVMGWLVGFT